MQEIDIEERKLFSQVAKHTIGKPDELLKLIYAFIEV